MSRRFADPSRPAALRLERVLALLFALVGCALIALIAAYWLWVLEPTLRGDAQRYTRQLAAAQAHTIEQTLDATPKQRMRGELETVVDSLLLLKDPSTGQPFTRRIELAMDYSRILGQPWELDLVRGDLDCDECLVSSIPLYRAEDRQLVGIATFHSSPKLLDILLHRFRKRLLWASGGILCLFGLAWVGASRLLSQLGNSEANLRSLFEAASVPMVLVEDGHRGVAQANAAAAAYLALRRSPDGGLSSESWRDLLARGLPSDPEERREMPIAASDGPARWALVSAKPVRLSGGPALLVSLADISELKATQEELHVTAITDGLTGLYNRRYLFKALDDEIARIRRYGGPLSVILCDIDRFKTINDTFGHRVGDEVLVEVAGAMRSSIRETDVAGRYGGEELLAILPRASGEEARATAERIRERVRSLRWSQSDLRVTLSGGVAELSPGMTTDSLIDRADRRLYAAKRAGRDRVLASDEVPTDDGEPNDRDFSQSL